MAIRTPGRPTRIAVAIPTTLFRINTVVLWKLFTQLSPNDVEVHISNNEHINCVSEIPSVTVEKLFPLSSINKQTRWENFKLHCPRQFSKHESRARYGWNQKQMQEKQTSNRTRHFSRKYALHPKNSRNGYKNSARLQKEKWTLYTCFLFKEHTQQAFLPQETQISQCMLTSNTYITGTELNLFFDFPCIIIDSCRVHCDNALVSGTGTAWGE